MFASKPVNTLTVYFGYHPSMKMSQVFGDEDKTVLNAFFSRKLKQGYTDRSLKRMVDRFWQSWGADSSRPAYTFTSNKVQQLLAKEAEIVKDDPVLDWMLEGMPNHGPFEFPAAIRKALLHCSNDVLNRYPELVADILRPDDAMEAAILWELEEVIVARLSRSKVPQFPELRKRVVLPKELEGAGPLRPRYDTIQEAIANIPLRKKLKW
jgi:hypothetical protein